MSPDARGSTERRYLLGYTDEDEGNLLERDYFRDEAAADRIADAEEALIDDYLDGTLDPADRRAFEDHYLASPVHRRRVELIQRLAASPSVAPPQRPPRAIPYRWLALAASLVLAVAAVWLLIPRSTVDQNAGVVSTPAPSATPAAPRPQPRVFAFTVPTINTRSADNAPELRIPAGTDIVSLGLLAPDASAMTDGTADIKTVAGAEVWSGPVRAGTVGNAAAAVADVPSARLRPDDYIVVLVAGGAERARYFLRVR